MQGGTSFVPPFSAVEMKKEETKRLRTVIFKTAIVLATGMAYALFVRLTGWGIPCVFLLITGLQCPGCGISRMFMSLLRLDFIAAARYNLLALCLLPFALGLHLYKVWYYVKHAKTVMGTAEKVFYCICFVLCIAFFVLRNTNLLP